MNEGLQCKGLGTVLRASAPGSGAHSLRLLADPPLPETQFPHLLHEVAGSDSPQASF